MKKSEKSKTKKRYLYICSVLYIFQYPFFYKYNPRYQSDHRHPFFLKYYHLIFFLKMSNDSFIPRYNEDDAAAAFGDFYQGPPHPSNQSGVPITPPPRYPRSREDTVELKRSEYDVLMKIAFTDFPLCLERLKAIDLQLSQIAFNANSGNGRVVMPALRIPSSQQQRTNRPPRLINRIKANVNILRI
jgi:hypothetical protein